MINELLSIVMATFGCNKAMAIYIIFNTSLWLPGCFVFIRVGFHAMHFDVVRKHTTEALETTMKMHKLFIDIHAMLLRKKGE